MVWYILRFESAVLRSKSQSLQVPKYKFKCRFMVILTTTSNLFFQIDIVDFFVKSISGATVFVEVGRSNSL